MAIAPIDLQTLYSQLDKVGKTYGSQAQALQMQNAITDVEKAKQQLEEKKKISSTAMPEEEDTQRVKDRQYNNPQNSEKKQNPESEEEIQFYINQLTNLKEKLLLKLDDFANNILLLNNELERGKKDDAFCN